MLAKSNLEYYPDPHREQTRKPNTKKRKVRRRKVNKKKKQERRLQFIIKSIYVFSALFALGVCLLLLYRYASIAEAQMEVNSLEKQKMELEHKKIDLNAKLDELKSSKSIEEDAMIKLGMDYPTEGQVVYISLEEREEAIKKEKGIKDDIKEFFDKVQGAF